LGKVDTIAVRQIYVVNSDREGALHGPSFRAGRYDEGVEACASQEALHRFREKHVVFHNQ
jgi:hypothetical protein